MHRLIFEDFYNIKLPSNIIIHHEDGDKANNNIWNLIPMTVEEHNTLHHKGTHHTEKTKKQISDSMKGEKNHFYGKHHSDETKNKLSELHKGKRNPHSLETKMNMSKNRNTSGYLNVSIQSKSITYPYFRYNYFKNGKCHAILSNSIPDLKRKVLEKNFCWKILDEELAAKTDELSELGMQYRNRNATNYYNVKQYSTIKGIRYVYFYKDENGDLKSMSSKYLSVLKDKVISNGYVWKELS